jgi:hypothetical protein
MQVESHATTAGSNFSARAIRAGNCSPGVYLDRRLRPADPEGEDGHVLTGKYNTLDRELHLTSETWLFHFFHLHYFVDS